MNYVADGFTVGDGTTVGKCPGNLKCFSSGECGICKIISSKHEGCSGSTPICDESTNPPTCGKSHQVKDYQVNLIINTNNVK